MDIVDTHQHLWDLERHHYSWLGDVPALNRSYLMSDYVSAVGGANIVASIHVEADVDEDDMAAETRWLLELCAQVENPLAGLVIKALPERANCIPYLEQFAQEKCVKGVRRVLHTQPDEVSSSTTFRDNVRRLAGFQWSFDLCVLGRQLPVAIELAQSCPDVKFVLDHCGVPDVKGRGLDPWRADIAALASLDNVFACKISGLVAYADPSWTIDDLRPFVDHVVSTFGHDRIVFGSDWPVCLLGASLRRWIDTAMELSTGWSEQHRRRFFAENARRVYRV